MLQLLSNNKGDHIISVLGAKFFNVLLIVGNTLELWVFFFFSLIEFYVIFLLRKGIIFKHPYCGLIFMFIFFGFIL